jgi:glycosyltransferase involved in cell wall biosynthesis
MKIAIIAHSLYPIAQPFEGGLECFTHLLCSALIQAGHQVDLYGHPASDPSLNVVQLHGLKYDATQQGTGAPFPDDAYLAQTEFYSRILHRINQQEYDVVHNHSLNDMAIILGNQCRHPFITTFHTPPFTVLQNGALAVRWDTRQVFTTVSKKLGAIWSEHLDESRVVYNGIAMDQWAYSATATDKVAVWCGRICPEKAPHYAIQTALDKGLTLYLAGPKSNLPYYEQEIAPYIDQQQIIYKGHLHQPELNALLKTATCLFFTSVWDEPYGLVIAEALACGTPVLGFATGAAPEILTLDCGVLVASGDQNALNAGYERVCALSRAACRTRAEQFCSSEAMLAAYLSLYQEVILEQATEKQYAL